jgi:small-conductance mechanosensitive channel
LVTRLRTARNEQVLVPNAVALDSVFVNYSTRGGADLAIETEVAIGYGVPAGTVERLLLTAAQRTNGLLAHPPPVARQAELRPDHVRHVLRAYINVPHRRDLMVAALNRSVLEVLAEAGVALFGAQSAGAAPPSAPAPPGAPRHPIFDLFNEAVRSVEAAGEQSRNQSRRSS